MKREFDLGRFLLRLAFIAMGVVAALALLAAAAVLLAAWGVRYAWARITGRPVTPWIMRFDPRRGFNRFGGSGGFGGFEGDKPTEKAADKAASPLYRAPEIADVEVKELRR